MTARTALARIAGASGALLFYGALLGLMVTLMVMVLGATGGLPTDGPYVGAIHVSAPVILPAAAGLGLALRRSARPRRLRRS